MDASLPSAIILTRNKGPSPRFATAELSNGSFVSIIARETVSEINRTRDANILGETKILFFFFSLFLNNKFAHSVKFITSK